MLTVDTACGAYSIDLEIQSSEFKPGTFIEHLNERVVVLRDAEVHGFWSLVVNDLDDIEVIGEFVRPHRTY